MSKNISQMIILPRQTKRLWLYGISFIIGLLLSGWLLFSWGWGSAGIDNLELQAERDRLHEEVATLQTANDALKLQIAVLEQSQQVEREAYSQVKDSLVDLEGKNRELREEIAFYRGIVKPKESSAGLRIEDFSIWQDGEERLFHYKLVLTQVLKNEALVKGSVNMVVKGFADDRPVEYSLEKLSHAAGLPMQFSFRYFQKFEGDILLPEGFKPRGVYVEVVPRNSNMIMNTFEWKVDQGKIAEEVSNL